MQLANEIKGPPLKVLIADDHPLMREGIAGVLSEENDIQVVAQVADGLAAVEAFRVHRPDVTLMDLLMPRCTGVEAISRIRREYADACILALSTFDGDGHVRRALDAGATGYVLKTAVCDDVAAIVRNAHAGRKVVSSELLPDLLASKTSRLTVRERDVLALVAKGHSNRQAAEALGISAETVKYYLGIVLQKLQANDRTHAVTIALSRGFLD